MIDQRHLNDLVGATAYDNDDSKIGSVDTVYVDDVTGEPKFAAVKTGLFGNKSSFVPLTDARFADGDLRVPYSKDKVKDAPSVDPDGHLSPAEEDELFRFYGLDIDTAATTDRTTGTVGTPGTAGDDAPGTVGHDTSGPTTDDAMTRSEEELRVGKERHAAGKARLRKHVVTEHVNKTVPVQREEVRVEREPVTEGNVDKATDGPAISEEEHEVTLYEEEPVVEKRAVPKERVRLDKEVHTDQEQVEDDVRKEEIDVADADGRNTNRR